MHLCFMQWFCSVPLLQSRHELYFTSCYYPPFHRSRESGRSTKRTGPDSRMPDWLAPFELSHAPLDLDGRILKEGSAKLLQVWTYQASTTPSAWKSESWNRLTHRPCTRTRVAKLEANSAKCTCDHPRDFWCSKRFSGWASSSFLHPSSLPVAALCRTEACQAYPGTDQIWRTAFPICSCLCLWRIW